MIDDFEPFDAIVCLWEDAMTDSTQQASTVKEALDSYCPTFRKTHGLFIGFTERKGRKALVIATEDDRENVPGSEACGGLSYIPSGMILSITRPTRKRRRKARKVETPV